MQWIKSNKHIKNTMNFLNKKWILKSVLTILLSQLGLFVLLVLEVPINNLDLCDVLKSYLLQGSVLLTVISLTADLIAEYFTDEKTEKLPLLFEYKKIDLAILIFLLAFSGTLYGFLPGEYTGYTTLLQVSIYLASVIMLFRINYLVMAKEESYSRYQDKLGKVISDRAKILSNINGVEI